MNTTMGPECLVPFLLVFGAFPRIPGVNATHPVSMRKRFQLMNLARAEYESVFARLRVQTGLTLHLRQLLTRFTRPETLSMFIARSRVHGPDRTKW
jgi:hypothetical protein